MNREIYDDFSQDYDRFVNWQPRLAAEIPFIQNYLQHIKEQTNRIPRLLDAACGSGMHAIELAKSGIIACGADLSPKMVEKAIGNAKSAGVKVKFLESPFGNLTTDFRNEQEFPFDMVTCLGNALPHLLSIEMIQTAIWDLSNCLQSGGYLLFQNRNFDAILNNRERWIAPQGRKEDQNEWIFLRFYDFDRDGLITFNIIRLHRSGEESWQQRISTTRLYPLKRDVLVGLLEDSGFTDITCFGLMADEPYNPATSENLVVAARKS
jgi:glycine/sarcosine N-methyltransferase